MDSRPAIRAGAALLGLLALPALAAAPAAAQAIRAGQTVSGALARTDTRLGDGSYYDTWTYSGRRGERLVIVMRSDAFDTYVAFGRGRGADFEQLETADDGADGTNTRLEVTLPADGEYVIRANSLSQGKTGAYTLALSHEDGGGQIQPVATRPADAGGAAMNRVERGTLGPGDGTLQSGEYRDSYTFEGRRGERVVLDLRSRDMDPYLILVQPDGEQIENDDFEGDQHRSLISTELAQDGSYRVLATTYRPKTTGSYELHIARGSSRVAAGGARRERGTLARGDQTLRSGEYVDRYTVEAIPGQRLRVDASSSAFDTYVIVKDPKNEQTENDDADGMPGHAVVDLEVTESGTYTVMVTSYQKGETGPYELTIDLGTASRGTSRARDAATLEIGRSVSGRLEQGDRTLEETGEFSDAYLVEGRPGETLVVELSSSQFDPYLIVRGPDGESVDNDDDNGSRTRSRVEVPMRAAGRYRVVATSYRRGETGSYTLAVRSGGAARVSPPTRPAVDRPRQPATPTRPGAGGRVASGRQRGTGRGGRVLGVFVGISDYGGRANDLRYTARDAATMRDALVRGVGMSPSDAIVLTDRQATVANVRSALHQMAGRVGPDDILVFFHSGHGGRVRVRAQDDDDPDGLDETIEMFDAAIRDDELGAMLDEVDQGMVMLVIDACYSGGFSKDVINKPGRVGFFSSEEDVVSAVAEKFRAGGFLPVFFAEAVGEARADTEDSQLEPNRDGQVTLLELSQYLRARYGDEVKGDGGGSGPGVARRELGYQHLVVDRGGVDAYSVMFRW
ncbi:MAG TPA: caspase family protein [Longimicrobium sp.]|jgi:hypothetical protein